MPRLLAVPSVGTVIPVDLGAAWSYGDTPPISPSTGDIWVDRGTISGGNYYPKLKIWLAGTWKLAFDVSGARQFVGSTTVQSGTSVGYDTREAKIMGSYPPSSAIEMEITGYGQRVNVGWTSTLGLKMWKTMVNLADPLNAGISNTSNTSILSVDGAELPNTGLVQRSFCARVYIPRRDLSILPAHGYCDAVYKDWDPVAGTPIATGRFTRKIGATAAPPATDLNYVSFFSSGAGNHNALFYVTIWTVSE